MKRREEGGGKRWKLSFSAADKMVDPISPGTEFFRRRRHGEPPVTQTRHALERVLVVAGGNPDRNRPPNRLGLNTDLRKAIVPAVIGKTLLGPQAAHHPNRFVQAAGPLLIRHAAS